MTGYSLKASRSANDSTDKTKSMSKLKPKRGQSKKICRVRNLDTEREDKNHISEVIVALFALRKHQKCESLQLFVFRAPV